MWTEQRGIGRSIPRSSSRSLGADLALLVVLASCGSPALTTPAGRATPCTSIEIDEAVAALQASESIVVWGGRFLDVSAEAQTFITLLRAPDAEAHFARVARSQSTAARIYGLCSLRLVTADWYEVAGGDAVWPDSDHDTVLFFTGCVGRLMTFAEAMGRTEDGSLPGLFLVAETELGREQ